MSNHNNDENLTSHEYDGIRELDNQLPRWWVQIFYLTIVFSIGYFAYYHIFYVGKQQSQVIDEELAQAEALKPVKKLEITADLFKDSGKKEKFAEGKAAFMQKCQSCHGPEGGGGVGPNLTDKYWIHGGKPVEIGKSIHDGYPAMGMPAWGPMLTENELVALVAYVVQIQGTTPANAKAPQGTIAE